MFYPIRNGITFKCSYVENMEIKIDNVLNPFSNKPWFFTCLQYKSFENPVGKGEIARNKQFSSFPNVFYTRLDNFLPISSNLELSSAKYFSLEGSKICRLGKG